MTIRPTSPLALSCGGAGLALLGLALLPAWALGQGSPAARLWVYLLLLAVAALALALLRSAGRLPAGAVLAALLPVGLAVFLRALALDYQSTDYQVFLSRWAEAFRDNGGFAAVALPIGNYNAPYLYFLAAISYLPLPDLYLIKLFSILFDVVLAWGGLRLVRHFTGVGWRPAGCFCALLLLPTAVLNGACWGQCDCLYAALCLHALSCGLRRRGTASAALMGLAFSFKLQTVFLLPLWAGLWVAGRVKLRQLAAFPAAYAATCVPALLLGKPLGDILGVYVGQTQEGAGALNYNSPSFYAFFPYGAQLNEGFWAAVGIALALLLVLAVLLALLACRRRVSDLALLTAGAVLAVGVPFLLPYMHDRYLYPADVLTLAWAFVLPRRAPVPVLVQLSSLSAYLIYFRQKFTLLLHLWGNTYTMLAESLLTLLALVWAVWSLGEELRAGGGTGLIANSDAETA